MSGYQIKDTTKEERIALIRSWQEPDDCVGGSGMDLFDMYDAYIRMTYELLDWEKLDRLAAEIYHYEKVAAFGCDFSETAALDLQTKLRDQRKFIVTNIDDQKQADYIRNADEKHWSSCSVTAVNMCSVRRIRIRYARTGHLRTSEGRS